MRASLPCGGRTIGKHSLHLSYLALTDSQAFEVGHPHSMNPFHTINIDAMKKEIGDFLEVDFLDVKLTVWQMVNHQLPAVPLFHS